MEDVHVRDARTQDAAAIAAIYNEQVRGTTVTFEVTDVDTAGMALRIVEVQARGLPWMALDVAGALAGYAYATPWKLRAAYARTVETSIYLASTARGRGLGKRLYVALLDRLRALDVHVAIAGIALPNDASVALHEALGFAQVGVFREVGFKHDRWIDVGYWHRPLSR